MSTSVLYRALGIRGYQHQAIKQDQGEVTLRMRHDGSELKCPGCGGTNVSRKLGRPTVHHQGTEGEIRALARRFAAGLILWHPQDADEADRNGEGV